MDIFNSIGKFIIGALISTGIIAMPAALVATPVAQPQNLGAAITQGGALYDGFLASGIATNATTMTLTSGAFKDGTSLSGWNCFTVDANSPSIEYICGTASDTIVSALQRGIGLVNPNTTSSALAFYHGRGASVQITDYPDLQILKRIVNGTDPVPNVLQYASTVTNAQVSANGQNLVNYNTLASTSFAGTVNGNQTTKGIFQEATPANIASGTTTGSTGANLTIAVGETATSSQGATRIVATRTDGTIDPSLISSSTTYKVGGISSQSSTFTGTTTIAGVNVTSTSFSKFGGTGVDGALTLAGTATSSINLGGASVVIKNYTSISITVSSSLLFSNPATNGSIVILKSQGSCTLTSSAASGTIVVSNLGAAAGSYGNSLSGGGPTAGYVIGGSFAQPGPSTEGFTTGFAGIGAHVAPSSTLIDAAFAGAGGNAGSNNGGAGGQGGGGLVIECGNGLNFTGTINAQGNVGANGTGSGSWSGSYCSAPGGGGNADGGGPSCSNTGTGSPTTTQGGGGGGGGSTIMLYNGTLTANTGTINVTGGNGGTGTHDNGQPGGAGYSFIGQNTEY